MNKIEIEKQKNIEFAEQHGISEIEMDKIYQDIYKDMPADLDDDKKTIRSLRKTRGSLKRLVQDGNRLDGFIFMRFPNQEYNLYAWNQVQKFIDENGLEKAIARGMAKDKDTYLHTEGFNKGKPIDKKQIYGNAVGIFQIGEEVKPREISIGSFVINNVLPVCKEAKIAIKEAQKDSAIVSGTKVQYFKNATVTSEEEDFSKEDADVYLDYLQQFYGDIIFKDFVSALSYIDSENDKKKFAVVKATCLEIIPSEDPKRDIHIKFEFEGEDDDDIDVWVHPTEYQGLNIYEGAVGYLFFNAIKRKDGTHKYHCGGFLPTEE